MMQAILKAGTVESEGSCYRAGTRIGRWIARDNNKAAALIEEAEAGQSWRKGERLIG